MPRTYTRPSHSARPLLFGGALFLVAAAVPGCGPEVAGDAEPEGAKVAPLLDGATVQVTITEGESTPLDPSFLGYNSALVWGAVSYRDRSLQSIAAPLGIQWLRYPAGTGSDAFDWTTGMNSAAFVKKFVGDKHHDDFQRELAMLSGKGGLQVDDMKGLVGAIGGQGIVVCVNGFTDTPASAGRFAQYAKDHGIRVLAWELSNEPYYFTDFFKNVNTYLDMMRPYGQAIHAVDPNATIAVFASDAGHPSADWDGALGKYRNKYWNAVTFHHYLPLSDSAPAATNMQKLNSELGGHTAGYVKNTLASRIGAGMDVLITEYAPSSGSGEGGIGGTLYGGIYAAEYALRMSQAPRVRYVGAHAFNGNGGIALTNDHVAEVQDAYNSGTSIDTSTLDFGYYVTAQGVAYSVAALGLKGATGVLATSAAGGGSVKNAAGKNMPAVFAQAYKAGAQTRLILTNKGAGNETVAITDAAHGATGTLHVLTATGPGALSTNSKAATSVQAVASTATGVVQLPAYSVVTVSW